MTFFKSSLVATSVIVVSCFMALLFCSAWGQEKGPKKEEAAPGQIAPPRAVNPKDDKTPWRAAQTPDVVKSTDSTEILFPDRQPYPPKGFAKGVIVTLGDDTGEPGTYRIAFKWEVNGQEFPLIECRLLQAMEDKLFTFGRDAHHGKLAVEVKGTVMQYRGMNFLLLNDFRLPEGPHRQGGVPAAKGGIKNLP